MDAAQLAGRDPAACFDHLGAQAVLLHDGHLPAGGVDGGGERVDLAEPGSQGLLDEHPQARAQAALDEFGVQWMRCADDGGIRIEGEQLVEVCGDRPAVLGGDRGRAGGVGIEDSHHLDAGGEDRRNVRRLEDVRPGRDHDDPHAGEARRRGRIVAAGGGGHGTVSPSVTISPSAAKCPGPTSTSARSTVRHESSPSSTPASNARSLSWMTGTASSSRRV